MNEESIFSNKVETNVYYNIDVDYKVLVATSMLIGMTGMAIVLMNLNTMVMNQKTRKSLKEK